MIVNLIVFIIVGLLVLTSSRRNYLGMLVLVYYGLFLSIYIGYFNFTNDILVAEDTGLFDILCLALCVSASLIASYIYYKGSNLAGLYSAWLIYNSIICSIGTFTGYGDGTFYFVYNLTQNLNLFVDLSVVILGTDNYLTRTGTIGSFIYRANDCIDKLTGRSTNNHSSDIKACNKN